MTWLLVAAGGALGSLARHGLNHFVQQRFPAGSFPLGIFLVNVFGSGLIGIVAGVLASGRVQWNEPARMFVIVGLLGGFTTFSSFSLDTLTLMRAGHHAQALSNVAGQVVLSLIGVWAGFRLGSSV
jgi:CrcB protein